MEEKRQRMRELVGLLREASKAYYQEDREIMSNFEYDRLYDELDALEKETGIVLSGSPTRPLAMNRRMSFRRNVMKNRCFLWIRQKMWKC